jgi:hypothetical protein
MMLRLSLKLLKDSILQTSYRTSYGHYLCRCTLSQMWFRLLSYSLAVIAPLTEGWLEDYHKKLCKAGILLISYNTFYDHYLSRCTLLHKWFRLFELVFVS